MDRIKEDLMNPIINLVDVLSASCSLLSLVLCLTVFRQTVWLRKMQKAWI
jgi:hypothetical protein